MSSPGATQIETGRDLEEGSNAIFLMAKNCDIVIKAAGEKKRPPPIPREPGDGWWERDLPEWHSGIEDDADKYPHWQPPDGPGHCFLKCPACNTFHDNEYIGKHRFITSDEKKKYEHIMKDIL